MPNSGQLLLRAPHNSFIHIGTRKFRGRHVTPIKVMRQIIHLDREKMDAWEKKQAEAGRSVNKAAFELARGTTPNMIKTFIANIPSWSWYNHLIGIIVVLVVIVIVMFVGHDQLEITPIKVMRQIVHLDR